MSYIHNSDWHQKIALSEYLCPSKIITEEMRQIEDKLEILEEQYEISRGKYRQPMNDEQRDLLYNKIIPISCKYWKLFYENNKGYCEYWNLTKEDFWY